MKRKFLLCLLDISLFYSTYRIFASQKAVPDRFPGVKGLVNISFHFLFNYRSIIFIIRMAILNAFTEVHYLDGWL